MNKLNLLFILISIFMNGQSIDIINPENGVGVKNWGIINDDVMGGVSSSSISINNENNIVFSGFLSLKNNGGFASSRLNYSEKTLLGIKSFKIKFRGDGNTYKLRLRQNNRRASYSYSFKSLRGKWIEKTILINDFKPTWRGNTYINYPELQIEKINTIGLQISDKQEGEFKLELKYLKALY